MDMNQKIFLQSVYKIAKKCIIHELKIILKEHIKNIKVSYITDKNNCVGWTVKFYNGIYIDKEILESIIKQYAGADLRNNLDNIIKIFPLFQNYVIDYYHTINK